jgi:hypothetical protein
MEMQKKHSMGITGFFPLGFALSLAIVLIFTLGCNLVGDELPTVILSDEGGTYETPEGIILEVPAGAVSEPTGVYITTLDKASTQTPLNENGLLSRELIAGVALTTEVNPLQKSIWVTLPINYSPVFTSIPLHYVYDEEMDSYYPAYTDLTLSPAEGTVAFSVNEFGTHVVVLVEQIDVPSARFAQKGVECETDPCRCGLVDVLEEAKDNYYSTTDCQISSIQGSAFYHECGVNGVTESWEFSEHTKGCVPRMKLTPERTVIEVGEKTSIQTLITYGEDPVSDIGVTMTPSGFVTLSPTTATTGIDGTAETVVKAGSREGLANIEAKADVYYAPELIKVNGQIQHLEVRHKVLHAKTVINVVKKPAERWKGSIELNYSGCLGWDDDWNCIGQEYSATVDVNFVLDYDSNILVPGPENTNVSGSGTATISLDTSDGPVFDLGPSGGCETKAEQPYIDATRTYPFEVSILGLMLESPLSKKLWVLFQHPSGDSQGVIMEMDEGTRLFCDGMVSREEVNNTFKIYWNPAIVYELDPAGSDEEEAYPLDLTRKTSVTKSGSCGSFFVGFNQECTYSLTMTIE